MLGELFGQLFRFLSRLSPGVVKEKDVSALLCCCNAIEQRQQNLTLQLIVMWYAEQMAHHEWHEDRARWFGVLCYIQGN